MTPRPEPKLTWLQTLARGLGMPVYNVMTAAWLVLFTIWNNYHHASNWWLLAVLGGMWLTDRLGRGILSGAGLTKKGEIKPVYAGPDKEHFR